jgi:hypothetical protein
MLKVCIRFFDDEEELIHVVEFSDHIDSKKFTKDHISYVLDYYGNRITKITIDTEIK